MKIAINATCFNNDPSGARNRFIGIYGQLFKQFSGDEFFVFEPRDCRIADWFSPLSNVQFIQTDQPSQDSLQRYIKGLFFWQRELKRIAPDIFETFNFPLVKSPVGRTILTIHDIRYVCFPELYSKLRGLVSRPILRRAFAGADQIIAVSHAIKNQLLQFYPHARISVLYNGVDADSFASLSDEDLSKVRKKYGLGQQFLLSVGHLEKRKNYPRLLKAVSMLKKRGHNFFLVIIGNDGDDAGFVLEQIRDLGLSDNVMILKNLQDWEVRCLYHLSSLFVFPSVYEGFGIPILEAMAARCPLVVSDLPVFREITENQSIYFNQDKAESIADFILKVYSSKSEQKRLIDYGLKRVRVFNYDKLAQDLDRIYRQ
jgi:glycosyltransferase involved in cell wall biosynthesis